MSFAPAAVAAETVAPAVSRSRSVASTLFVAV